MVEHVIVVEDETGPSKVYIFYEDGIVVGVKRSNDEERIDIYKVSHRTKVNIERLEFEDLLDFDNGIQVIEGRDKDVIFIPSNRELIALKWVSGKDFPPSIYQNN